MDNRDQLVIMRALLKQMPPEDQKYITETSEEIVRKCREDMKYLAAVTYAAAQVCGVIE